MKKNIYGFSIIYVFFLITMVLSFGVVVLNKQSFFEKKLEYSEIEDILLKNIITAGNLSINYNLEINKDNGTYKPFLSCPSSVNFFSGSTLISTGTSYYENGYCSGSLTQGTFNIYYDNSKIKFLNGILGSTGFTLTGTTTLTGTITVTSSLVFQNPTLIDTRFINSRIENNGIILKNTGYNNIFWNNNKVRKNIDDNTNNTGGISKLSNISSGSLYFDINGGFSGKLVEFNRSLYDSDNKILKVSEINFSTSSGAIGYLQQDLTISGSLLNAKQFDLKNKDYAIFISYNTGALDNIRYKFKIYDNQTSNFSYINPIKDDSEIIEYMGSNILINNGQFINKIYKLDDYRGVNNSIYPYCTGSGSIPCLAY